MSKIIYVCAREGLPVSVEERLRSICRSLEPDNIVPPPPRVSCHGNSAYGVMNPSMSMREKDGSVVVGQLLGDENSWQGVLSGSEPDGSYALFRNKDDRLEITSDPTGSRAIWYYKDEKIFIASTSQRAVVMFTGSFEFNEKVIPWMLSSGCLGPLLSWDKRIELLPADSSLVLNKQRWSVSMTSNPIDFAPLERSEDRCERMLREALETTFAKLSVDFSKWVLPLSGGYDSRAILFLLRDAGRNIGDLRTVTWGLESRRDLKGSDAYIAKRVAEALHVSNEYHHVEFADDAAGEIIDRFVLLGEGRIDHLSGYMDGFEMWRTFFEDGIRGIVRGDEGFGWKKPALPTEWMIRRSVGLSLCSDFYHLRSYENYGFPAQKIPRNLLRHAERRETLAAWRDRLYHQYRMPTILSALTDLKISYVEEINPFLSRNILGAVRRLPDSLRTDKYLFSRIVESWRPEIGFATTAAVAPPRLALREKGIAALIEEDISSEHAKSIFPSAFLNGVLKNMNTKLPRTSRLQSYRSKARALLGLGLGLDPNILAFRAFIISRMNAILNRDCRRISRVE